jgi:serine/threonine protein phosphatase 1
MLERELAVVGDVHGDANRLERALDDLLDKRDLHIIFTGDYIDRGPNSKQALDLILAAQRAHPDRLTFLRGNHENALLTYLSRGFLADFAAHGGLATIRSYLTVVRSGAPDEFRRIFPPSHRALLDSMPASYEDEEVLVSHTGFDPADPWNRSFDVMCNRNHADLFRHVGPWPTALTICGHYVQIDRQPYISQHLICVDTGCGTLADGPLTALILPERAFRQY